MSSTYQAAVEQTFTAGEQIHQIVNGTATTEVTVEDGSRVPSIRKALLDNFYFKDPIAWQVGQTENVFNQLRQFTDGSWWYAPSATASNPISMGSTPVGDPLWKAYSFDAIGKLTPQIRESLRRSYAEAGYSLVDGSFEVGGKLVNANDVLLQERTGKAFSGPAGTVAAGTNPASGGFVDKSGVATSASAISNANGGSVQDFIDAQYTTVAELATGKFRVGQYVRLTDRANGLFLLQSGGTQNWFDILDAGNGNTAVLQIFDSVNILEIGLVGDGIADDTLALQRAFEISFLQQKSLVGADLTCRTTDTIYIGNYGNSTKYTSIDLRGLTFKPDDSVDIIIDSGKLVGGVWVTAWADPIETYMSFFTTFGNFNVVGLSDASKGGRTAVRLKDWHYQCELKHIGMINFETGLSIKHVFGIEINQCSLFNTNPSNRTGQGFLLDGNVNLVKLHRCLSTNTKVGYYLKGGVSSVSINNCSFEGQAKGLVCQDAVYALEVNNCYLENITDVCFTFQSQVYSANIANNYINMSTAASSNVYILDYLELPNNNIQFDATNYVAGSGGSAFPDDRFIKNMNLHTTFGYNRFSLYKRTSFLNSLSDLLVDNTRYPKGMNLDHTLVGEGLKANVVNNFAIGNYSGRYTDGYARQNGFLWNNLGNSTLQIDTRITESDTGRIYVNLRVSASGLIYTAGEFVKYGGTWKFYEFDNNGLVLSSDLSIAVVGGFMRISGTYANTVTNVLGEVRLV